MFTQFRHHLELIGESNLKTLQLQMLFIPHVRINLKSEVLVMVLIEFMVLDSLRLSSNRRPQIRKPEQSFKI